MTLTFALYYIVANRTAFTRLRDEIRLNFKTKEEITGQSVAMLSYLDAVITESNPPAPSKEGSLID